MKSLLKEVYELNHFLFSLCPCVLKKTFKCITCYYVSTPLLEVLL